jgi:hypothetical protein
MTKIPDRFIPEIKESMLDAELTTRVNSVSNSNIVKVSNVTEITNAGEDAVIEFQEPITLIANFTSPLNQVWFFTTGYLDIDTYDLDFNGAKIYFNGKRKGIDIFNGTVSGTVYIGNDKFYISNVGGIDDGLTTTDNFNVEKQALHIANQNGNLNYNKQDTGIYYSTWNGYDYGSALFPVIPNEPIIRLIGNGRGVSVVIDSDVIVAKIPDNKPESVWSILYDSEFSEICGGGTLKGDRFEHLYDMEYEVNSGATSSGILNLRIIEHFDFIDNSTENTFNTDFNVASGTVQQTLTDIVDFINTDPLFADYTAIDKGDGMTFTLRGQAGQFFTPFLTDVDTGATFTYNDLLHEWGHGIQIGSNAHNSKIHDINIIDMHGDGIARGTHSNGTGYLDVDDMSVGNVLDDGTVDPDNAYRYQTVIGTFLTVENHFRLQTRARDEVDLLYFRYWLAYYDENDNFIEKSPRLNPYDYYNVPEGYVKYRVIVDYNGDDFLNFDYNITSSSFPTNAHVYNVNFKNNRRHAITNLPSGSLVEHCDFRDTGGVNPAGHINIEDYGAKVQNVTIRENKFWNGSAFDIITRGLIGLNVYGNFHNAPSWNITGVTNYTTSAINTGTSKQVNIHHNIFDEKSVTVESNVKFDSNIMKGGKLLLTAQGGTADNLTMADVKVHANESAESLAGASRPTLKNSKLTITEPWGNESLIDDNGIVNYQNFHIIFNEDPAYAGSVLDTDLRYIKLNDTNKTFSTDTTLDTDLYRGWIDGFIVEGCVAVDDKLHQYGWTFYANDMKRVKLSTSLKVENGYEKDFKMSDIDVLGWIWLELGEFPTDGVGTFKKLEIQDLTAIVPPDVDTDMGYLDNINGTTQKNNLFRVKEDVNINIHIKDSYFENQSNITGLFCYLGNRGETVFDNCSFVSAAADVIDFTSTGVSKTLGVHTGANTGAITIIDPKLTNISFTLRSIDHVIFTKVSPYMATYATFADETAADAAGYPSGYLYMTATGEPRIKL